MTTDAAAVAYRARMAAEAARLRRQAVLYDALAHPREEAVAVALTPFCPDPDGASLAALRASDEWEAKHRA